MREHQLPLPTGPGDLAVGAGAGVDQIMVGAGAPGESRLPGGKRDGSDGSSFRPYTPGGGGSQQGGAGVAAPASAAAGGADGSVGAGPDASGAGGVNTPAVHASIDAEMEDQAGRVLADEVAASSLTPAPPAGTKAPTLAGLINTESLESAAEKAESFRKPPELVADRVAFLINNLTEDTLEKGASDLKPKVCVCARARVIDGQVESEHALAVWGWGWKGEFRGAVQGCWEVGVAGV